MKRGEVWWVNLEPGVGDEQVKVRLCVVVNPSGIGRLRLRVVVPFTTWQARFQQWPWMVEVKASATNGLKQDSAADCFQVRSLSVARFKSKVGELDAADVDAVADALKEVVGG